MNRDPFVAANWCLPLMPDPRTSHAIALRQGLGAHTFPLIIKTILPITGRRAGRTGATEKWAQNISVFNISVIFIREIRTFGCGSAALVYARLSVFGLFVLFP
jgi:hypothetical protein